MVATTAILQIAYQHFHIGELAYHRGLFTSKWYLLLSPSLVHYNWTHWFFNIFNLFALLFIFNDTFRTKNFILFFSLSSAFIMTCLYLFDKEVKVYVGMSGVLYAMAIYAALRCYQRKKVFSVTILLYVFLKLVDGERVNDILFVSDALEGMEIITSVHHYGAVFGFIAACCVLFVKSS